MTRKKRFLYGLIGVWFIGLITLLSAHRHTSASSFEAQNPDLMAGSKIFTPTCSNGYCHGKDGSGGSAPSLRGKAFTTEFLIRVIANGIPGTPMPAFKNAYSQKEIEQLAAYVLWLSKTDASKPLPALPNKATDTNVEVKLPANSDSKGTKSPVEQKRLENAEIDGSIIIGDSQAGKQLFFDAMDDRSCRVCHSFQGRGGKLASDLSAISSKSPRELLQSIVAPGAIIAQNYSTIKLTTSDGETIVGVKGEEDAESVRVYDTSSLPPVLRTIQKANVAKIEQMKHSVMPIDYASRYTLKQLLDLIAFLKSADKSQTTVSLKDLF
jgi:putative heme-binding domain-containing protein